MAINIQFTDFDTVCYSVQHNLMKLIEKAVGLSIEVNINAANISQTKQEIEDMKPLVQEGHDAWLLSEGFNRDISSNKYWINAILNNELTFQSEPLGQKIKEDSETIDDIINFTERFQRTRLGKYLAELDDRIGALGG